MAPRTPSPTMMDRFWAEATLAATHTQKTAARTRSIARRIAISINLPSVRVVSTGNRSRAFRPRSSADEFRYGRGCRPTSRLCRRQRRSKDLPGCRSPAICSRPAETTSVFDSRAAANSRPRSVRAARAPDGTALHGWLPCSIRRPTRSPRARDKSLASSPSKSRR